MVCRIELKANSGGTRSQAMLSSPVVSGGRSCRLHTWAAKLSRIMPQPSLWRDPSGAKRSGNSIAHSWGICGHLTLGDMRGVRKTGSTRTSSDSMVEEKDSPRRAAYLPYPDLRYTAGRSPKPSRSRPTVQSSPSRKNISFPAFTWDSVYPRNRNLWSRLKRECVRAICELTLRHYDRSPRAPNFLESDGGHDRRPSCRQRR